jgi:hypothetical protein
MEAKFKISKFVRMFEIQDDTKLRSRKNDDHHDNDQSHQDLSLSESSLLSLFIHVAHKFDKPIIHSVLL